MNARRFKAARFVRDGTVVGGNMLWGYRLGVWRSFKTLHAAITGVRLDIAELEADGVELPEETVVRHEQVDQNGSLLTSEIVAIWKRGRFMWVDPVFRKMERGLLQRERPLRSSLVEKPDRRGRNRIRRGR